MVHRYLSCLKWCLLNNICIQRGIVLNSFWFLSEIVVGPFISRIMCFNTVLSRLSNKLKLGLQRYLISCNWACIFSKVLEIMLMWIQTFTFEATELRSQLLWKVCFSVSTFVDFLFLKVASFDWAFICMRFKAFQDVGFTLSPCKIFRNYINFNFLFLILGKPMLLRNQHFLKVIC